MSEDMLTGLALVTAFYAISIFIQLSNEVRGRIETEEEIRQRQRAIQEVFVRAREAAEQEASDEREKRSGPSRDRPASLPRS